MLIVAACAAISPAAVLYSNGPLITSPTGGTGTIAGQPLSKADNYTVGANTFSTTGYGAAVVNNTAAAEDFTVPAGGWDLDTATFYAFQSSQTTASVTQVRVNLWTSAPYSASSSNPPSPLPQPVLATDLQLTPISSQFVAHRVAGSSTNTVRPIFAYTVSLNDLPNGGFLDAGTYWLQFSFVGAASPSANVFTPLVSPRDSVTGHNARFFGVPLLNTPAQWYEAREGYVNDATPGRAVAVPFELNSVPEPTGLALLSLGGATLLGRRGKAGRWTRR